MSWEPISICGADGQQVTVTEDRLRRASEWRTIKEARFLGEFETPRPEDEADLQV